MAEDRVERLTNLVTFLLDRAESGGATYGDIVEQIPGWPEGADARRRAFERDKKVLRDEGIPLVERDGRYHIPPDQYYLPDLDLTDDEQVALRLAVAAVRLGGDAGEVGGLALHKLGGGGDGAGVAGAAVGGAPVVAALDEDPLLPTLHTAMRRRSLVRFRYGGSEREVEPLLLLFRDTYWYMSAHDRARDALRTFRVDRIEGDVAVGEPGEFEPREAPSPTAAMPRERWLIGGEPEPITAVVEVDAVLASKAAGDVGGRATVEPLGDDGGVRLTMEITNRDAFRSWVLGLLDHAVVLSPPALREDVVSWLRAIASAPLPSP